MFCDLNIPCTSNPDRVAMDKLKLILSQLTQCKAPATRCYADLFLLLLTPILYL